MHSCAAGHFVSLDAFFPHGVECGWECKATAYPVTMAGLRAMLFALIEATPHLDWLLLTKRPENIAKLFPSVYTDEPVFPNVWLGVTAEDQDAYDRRWPILAKIPARVRFVSYEPACGPLSILDHEEKPEWLICGGMTGRGPGFVEMPSIWAEDVMEECDENRVAFFMKQMSSRRTIPDDLLVRQFPPGVS